MERLNYSINYKRFFSEFLLSCFFILLFIQAAIVNIEGLPDSLISVIKPLEELFLIIIMIFSIFIVDYSRVFRFSSIQIMLFVFTLHLIGSAIYNNVTINIALSSWVLFIKGFMFYWVISKMQFNTSSFNKVIRLLIGFFIFCSIVAFLQLVGINLLWEPEYRLHFDSIATTSIFNHHTLWATAISLAVCISLGLYFPEKKKIYLALFLVFFISLLLTTSRRHLVAIPFAFLITTFLLGTGFKKYIKLFRLFLLFGFIGLLFLPWLITVAQGTFQEYVVQAETRDRFALYIGAVELANDSPIFGRGPGMYGSWPSLVYKSPVYSELGIDKIVKPEFMNGAPIAGFIGEFGWVGFSIISMMFFSVFKRIISLIRKSKDNYPVFQLGIVVLLLFFNGITETIVHPYFTGSIATYIFFGLMGLFESLFYNTTNKYETIT